jgi:hypothetical protein
MSPIRCTRTPYHGGGTIFQRQGRQAAKAAKNLVFLDGFGDKGKA